MGKGISSDVLQGVSQINCDEMVIGKGFLSNGGDGVGDGNCCQGIVEERSGLNIGDGIGYDDGGDSPALESVFSDGGYRIGDENVLVLAVVFYQDSQTQW